METYIDEDLGITVKKETKEDFPIHSERDEGTLSFSEGVKKLQTANAHLKWVECGLQAYSEIYHKEVV